MKENGRVRGFLARAGGAAGMAGPAAFTAAWVIGSLRQSGYPATEVQISGLAAPDARDPWIMIAGFVVLGGCTVAFGMALEDALGGRGQAGPAPRLIQGAGLLTVTAGLLRRDQMLLTPGPASWHNQAHDAISAVIYSGLVVAQLLLAVRFGRAPRAGCAARWEAWRPWLLGSAAATAVALIPFGADTSGPAAGILQRIAVSIPLGAMAAIAARLVTMARTRPRNG
jgi:Protein of unknown function (DUF998)